MTRGAVGNLDITWTVRTAVSAVSSSVQSCAGRGLGPVLGGHSHAGPAHLHGPQDGKLDPDGSAYYVADCEPVRLWMLDGAATTARRFIPTGRGVHGFTCPATRATVRHQPRRRQCQRTQRRHRGADHQVAHSQWRQPLTWATSPADGFQLWFSGRYDNVVCVPSTVGGAMMRNFR